MTLSIRNQNFELHPLGAIFWQEKQTLLIADVHLGKVSHFRKHGSAIPHEASFKNFELLGDLIQQFKPQQICFLGDLFHSHLNKEWILFENWRNTFAEIDILLIIGNHDIISPSKYEKLHIKTASEWVYKQFLFTHYPEERVGFFNFSGHIHPGVALKGIGKQYIKLPCFHKKPNQLVLPAFGVFTGKFIISPEKGELIYAISDHEVLEIPPSLLK